jgi:hypothetical protein
MASPLDRRLRQLEEVASPSRLPTLIWREIGQTAEQAIAARFPDGIPTNVLPVVLSWLTPAMAEARGLS